jgi:tetratricopeptide (TPR) repeat protein
MTRRHHLGDKTTVAAALNNLCDIQLQSGEVPEARKSCDQPLKLMVETSNKHGEARTQQVLANALLAVGDLPGAEKLYQQALQTQLQLKSLADVASLQESLASLHIEKGDFVNAEKFALQALDSLLQGKVGPNEVTARCTLAQAYLGMRRNKDAEEQILKARERVYGLQGPFPLAVFSIQQAIVEKHAETIQRCDCGT